MTRKSHKTTLPNKGTQDQAYAALAVEKVALPLKSFPVKSTTQLQIEKKI